MGKSHKNRKRHSRKSGGGWSDRNMIVPGYLEHVKYGENGTDCAGTPMRPGYMLQNNSLPGVYSGGNLLYNESVKNAVITKYNGGRRKSKKNLKNKKRRGGRYAVIPSFINEGSPIGASGPSHFQQIPCESSRPNSLNLHTGGNLNGFPLVNVGQSDMMTYNTPNAGYGHSFEQYKSPSPIGGLMFQNPYDSKSMNQACLKSGGNRLDGAPLTSYTVGNRYDFDGSMKGLPVKYGGKRIKKSKKKSKRRL